MTILMIALAYSLTGVFITLVCNRVYNDPFNPTVMITCILFWPIMVPTGIIVFFEWLDKKNKDLGKGRGS